jgi:hypothetical protein
MNSIAMCALITISACGYSEAEMQLQRDKSERLTTALYKLDEDATTVRARAEKLAIANIALQQKLEQCPPTARE